MVLIGRFNQGFGEGIRRFELQRNGRSVDVSGYSI